MKKTKTSRVKGLRPKMSLIFAIITRKPVSSQDVPQMTDTGYTSVCDQVRCDNPTSGAEAMQRVGN